MKGAAITGMKATGAGIERTGAGKRAVGNPGIIAGTGNTVIGIDQ